MPAPTLLPMADLTACCSPATGQVLERASAEQLADLLKALAEPTRLQLISILASAQPDPVCVCDLTEPVGLTQPTVSHHLKVLTDAGLLTREQRGRWAYYTLNPGSLAALATAIQPTPVG